MNRRKAWSELKPYFREDRDSWEVSVPRSLGGGKRVRLAFNDETAAKKWIAEKALDHAKGKAIALTARNESEGMKVSELAKLYLSEKVPAQGKDSGRILSIRIDHLLKRFGTIGVEEVSPWHAKQWLLNLKMAQRTRYGVFSEARSLFRWGLRYDLVKTNPFDRMEGEGKGIPQKEILKPNQMEQLLKVDLPDYMKSWLALGGFAGIRTIEVQRMEWPAVKHSLGQIFIGEGVIKRTRGLRHRYVDILPALEKHLPKLKSGLIMPVNNNAFAYWRKKLCDEMNWDRWPQNALRHSFATYHLAMWSDAAKTSHQMGHTTAEMIHSNYAEAATKAEAKKWWGM